VRTVFPQAAEEELKREFFADLAEGYFVEVGANDAEILSQSYSLEQRGWHGILIEPQPDLASALQRRRKAQVFAEACSSRHNAGSRLRLHLAGGHSSFDASLNVADIKPHGTIEVPVRTLDDILVAAGAAQIDFISIDVEGHELDVLDGFDLSRWQPRLIVIEDLLLHTRLHRYLTRRGYRWLRRTGINNWYVPAANLPALGPLGYWQFVNKVYLGVPTRRLRAAWRRRRARPRFVNA